MLIGLNCKYNCGKIVPINSTNRNIIGGKEMKKVVPMFLTVIMILSVCVCYKIVLGQSEEKTDINLAETAQSENKDSEYFQYISRKIASEIKDNYEFTNAEIDVTHMEEAVDVHISGENTETTEAEIKSYVSKCLDVPFEDVNIYFD
jgi:hypothetical protein